MRRSVSVLDFRGSPIHCVAAGDDLQRPAVLLVHGFGASTDHWRHNFRCSPSYEVHALDLLGFGRSAKPLEWPMGERCGVICSAPMCVSASAAHGVGGQLLGWLLSFGCRCCSWEDCAGVVLLNAAGPFSEEKAP